MYEYWLNIAFANPPRHIFRTDPQGDRSEQDMRALAAHLRATAYPAPTYEITLHRRSKMTESEEV